MRRSSQNKPTSLGDAVNNKLTFFGMVGVVMAALHLKERWDDYKQVSGEEGAVALPPTPSPYKDSADDEEIGLSATAHDRLLDTELPSPGRPKRQRRDCCVCCGMRCGLFWKAFGIVVLLFTLWNAFKLIRWAVTDPPSGLELMPEYSTSLGCLNAPHVFGGQPAIYTVPMGSEFADWAFDNRGAAVGTIVIAEGDAVDGTDKIRIELTLRTSNAALLDSVVVQQSTSADPRFRLNMPLSLPDGACMRYDMTIFVPPALRKLYVASHTVTHVKYADQSHIGTLDDFFVTFYSNKNMNLLLPTAHIAATRTTLEMQGGYMFGDVALLNKTTLLTQRGDAIANVRVIADPYSGETDAPAQLKTVTGYGRSDFVFENPHARPILAEHRSSGNADLYLTYRDAGFNGHITLDTQSYTATGMLIPPGMTRGRFSVGDEDGTDQVDVVSPRGWVGLYF